MKTSVYLSAAAASLALFGAGCLSFDGSSGTSVRGYDPKPSVSSGMAVTAKGMVERRGSQYVITGDANFPGDMYVQNSFDAEVDAALKVLVGKEAEVYGRRASANSGDVMVMWVNGHALNTEAELGDGSGSMENKSFVQFYGSLNGTQKDCIVRTFGQTKIDAWMSTDTTLSVEENAKLALCTSQ